MSDRIRELTVREAELPYAKFYNYPTVPAGPAIVKAFENGPIAVSAAVLPQNINEIFVNPGDKAKHGYALIPCEGAQDGGYLTFQTEFPQTRLDMLQWWFAWRGLESINYTIANSRCNHSIAMSEPDKKKIRADYLPDEAKTRGIIQSAVKDTGKCGLEDFIIHFVRPEDMEIDTSHLADPKVAFFGGWWMREDRQCNDPYKKAIDMFTHICRETRSGVDVNTYVWAGYRCLKGKNRRMDSYGPEIDGAYVKQLGLAYAQEMANLASILPQLYAITYP